MNLFKGDASMTGDPVLDGLVEVFPEVNFSTLIEVAISFKGDIDAAADYVIHNVLQNIIPDDNNTNTNEDLYIHGQYQVSGDTDTNIVNTPVGNDSLSESVQIDTTNEYSDENRESTEQLMQLPATASTSGQAGLPEESNTDSLVASAENSVVDHEVTHPQNQQKEMNFSDHLIGGQGNEEIECSFSEIKQGLPIPENKLKLNHDGLPDMNMGSSYSFSPESLDDAISTENYKKNTLLSNVAAISEMLEEVELSEAETKHIVSEASQAGSDILVKVAKLKALSTLAAEENNEVAAEVLAEKSILASEAKGLQFRLSTISEERNRFVFIIDEMHQTLQRRFDLAEADRAAAEAEIIGRETMTQQMLKEQEVLLDAAKEESKKLKQQAQENAKLRELLMDRGHVVDALHGEMLGIFNNIAQLQYRVDMGLPVEEPQKLASSSMSSSVDSATFYTYQCPVEEPAQLASSNLPSPVKPAPSKLAYVDEPLERSSLSLAGSVDSAPSKLIFVGGSLPILSSSVKSAASESSWSSATESNSNFNGDEEIDDLDDSWDVVEEDEKCLC